MRHAVQHGIGFLPSRVIRQTREPPHHGRPTGQRLKQAILCRLQHPRMIAKLRGFSDRLVDHRVERDDLSYEFASNRLHVRQRRTGQRQCGAELARDLG